jgi:glycosyltransferase involved in cell wall biosynthesis
VFNVFEAAFRQGDVNHITGDVHYVALLLRKRRTLLTVLDCVSLNRLTGWRRRVFKMVWYVLPIWRSGLVSTISEFSRQELVRLVGCDPAKVRVVYVPVSDDFHPDVRPFNAECPRVLQVGTGTNKNLIRVAEALRGIPCHLDIIGPLTSEQADALRLNDIRYTQAAGITDAEVVERYRHSDMVMFASTYEGFGMPIIEANATGRPVITSNIGPMPEVAADAACLVDPFSVDSIREGVLRVLRDANYQAAIVANGYRNVERFRSAEIARQYVEIYEELLRS